MDFERRREEELDLVEIFIILLVYFNATLFSSFFFLLFFYYSFSFLSCITLLYPAFFYVHEHSFHDRIFSFSDRC